MEKMQLAQEYPPPGEAAYTQDLAERLKAMIIKNNPVGNMPRDAHPKMHGLVKAEFIVEPDLPEQLRVGIFKEAKTYEAWIRFSNQNDTPQADIKGDIRGMAIKVMGVPGEKLLEQEKNATTQDFIVVSTPIFVAKDVQEFDGLVKALTTNFFSTILYMITHLDVAWLLFKTMQKFANPLQIRYFSTTPYLFGTNAVKYSAIPHVDVPDAIPANPSPDYLREAMIKQLAKGDTLFDFCVQLQTDAVSMPIENPTKEWDETVSPFRKVASIKILQQTFDSEKQRTFGENLSFTPWHSLPEHRPLGGINRARKIVYAFISTFRHQRNGVARVEPTSWEI